MTESSRNFGLLELNPRPVRVISCHLHLISPSSSIFHSINVLHNCWDWKKLQLSSFLGTQRVKYRYHDEHLTFYPLHHYPTILYRRPQEYYHVAPLNNVWDQTSIIIGISFSEFEFLGFRPLSEACVTVLPPLHLVTDPSTSRHYCVSSQDSTLLTTKSAVLD